MAFKSKEDLKAFIVEHTGIPDTMDLDVMTYKELQEMAKGIKESLKQADVKPEPKPIIVKPGGDAPGGERAINLEGYVNVGGREVHSSCVVAYTGDDINKKGGFHSTVVDDPDRPGLNKNVVFNMMPELWKGAPVAIIDDWRLRANLLFRKFTQVTNMTRGTQVIRVARRKEYTTPLDLSPDKALISRMVAYVKGEPRELDEAEGFASSLAGTMLPD